MTTIAQLPLPHFLNLPLPPIPPDPSSKINSSSSNNQPLVFKLNLSPDQFEQLLNLDSEIEEGEEGGLRLEFDQSGKGKLHLSPNHLLQLDPPRSGPSRTNKPEEIYCHTSISTPSSSRSPLTGLLKIPSSTCVYDLQRIPISDPKSASTDTSLPDSFLPNQPNHHHAQTIKNSNPTSELSQREKLAGQRLKEKRLEEDKKKKEKQMVVLPDSYFAGVPAPKRTRQTKPKAPNKQQFPATIKQQPATAPATNGLSSNKNQPQPITSVVQPLPPRRALPGSQTGKHLAHVHNQHLSNPPTSPLRPISSQSKPEPSLLPQSLPIPAPPAVVFKPPNSSNGRSRPANLNQSTLPEPKLPPSPEPPSATKLSISTELSSISDEGEVEHPQADATTLNHKLPTPPLSSLKHPESSQLPKSPPDVFKNETHIHPPRTSPSDPASQTKRSSSKRAAEVAIGKTADYSSQLQHTENPAEGNSTASTPVLPPFRPKKSQKRNKTDSRPTQSNPEPTNHSTEPPPSNNRPTKTEDQPRKPTITLKTITVPAAMDVNQSVESSSTAPIIRKRILESENATINALNKRVRQDEGGSGLPTIRKVIRAPAVNGERSSTTPTTNGKRIKKKKKLKQPIDYTSSEVEEGEEPGEIVRSSARTRPPPPETTASTTTGAYDNDKEVTGVSKSQPSNKIPSVPIPPEPPIEEQPVSRSNNKANHLDKPPPPPTTSNPPPPANNKDKNNNNNTSSTYHNTRLLFHKLLKHYEFVSTRLEEFKENKRKFSSFQEVEELLFEAYGLEIELDRLKNRIIRNWS